ncbi:hypothetical protein LTR37_005853 [Vermiconidia calcicola]|uniref:Uncharacterized protein n=1 Tax=Vermiconidia calcicola TaxID=1690605 RepID=A0ACC3NI61_9PEZI|nr:hypothetical protein LTR37_005853 [Vermiconidia calcicola]
MCSSSKHPLSDRRLFHSLPRDLPISILTVNPDRLTRRLEEINTIVADLAVKGGSWFSSGFDLQAEGSDVRDWNAVSGESADILKELLKLGRQRAFQMSFYWRRNQAMIRLNHAAENSKRVLPQLHSLRTALA